MQNKKKIILCADDYGLNDAVSQGIYELSCKKRLSAVSCLVFSKDFQAQAKRLSELKNNLSIGLHFNLTESSYLSASTKRAYRLPELIFRAKFRLLSFKKIEQEFLNQRQRFEDCFGFAPNFIDGHQHVHCFPLIRDILLKNTEESIFFRNTWPGLASLAFQNKQQIIAACGGRDFNRLLQKKGHPANAYFAGIYDFNPATDYRAFFVDCLKQARNQTLIMCHPADKLHEADPIAQARVREYQYFNSEQFIEDCERYHIELCPVSLIDKPKV